MATFTITLSDAVRVPLGDTGKFTEVPIKDFPASTIQFAVHAGFQGALNNISRGKDEKGKPLSDDAWAALRAKRVQPWIDGTSWGSTTRESNIAPLKEAFIADMRAKYAEMFPSDKAVEDYFAGVVKETLGKDEKATFANMMAAIATQKAKANGSSVEDETTTLMDIYGKMAEERAEQRKAATSKLDVSGITFG